MPRATPIALQPLTFLERALPVRRCWRLALLGVVALAAAVALAAPAGAAVSSCSRYASPAGQDSWPGTQANPLRTVQRLLYSLRPGETGCLLGGTFTENVTFRTGGLAGQPITLASAPGTRAAIVGRLWIADTANWVTIADLNLDGRNGSNLPSPTVNGDQVVFTGNDVTNQNTTICFVLGSHSYGVTSGVVIERNRIHNCGRLPATNHHHGIYVEASRGAVIRNNWIYDNADRGIQLYPDAQGTAITNNVIEGNGTGVIFSGDTSESAGTGGTGYFASSNNVVQRNIITGSALYNVDSWWTGARGTGNVVTDNCLWGAGRANMGGDGGYGSSGNVLADPGFASATANNFTVASGSPCAGYGPGGSGISAPTTPAPAPSPAPQPAPTPTPQPAPAPTAPVNVSAPTIAMQGSRAIAQPGTWKTGTTRPTYTFQWLRCDPSGAACAPIPGATGAIYNLSRTDLGRALRVQVTARVGASSATATSAPVVFGR